MLMINISIKSAFALDNILIMSWVMTLTATNPIQYVFHN